jgi:hypothetical protein
MQRRFSPDRCSDIDFVNCVSGGQQDTASSSSTSLTMCYLGYLLAISFHSLNDCQQRDDIQTWRHCVLIISSVVNGPDRHLGSPKFLLTSPSWGLSVLRLCQTGKDAHSGCPLGPFHLTRISLILSSDFRAESTETAQDDR